MTIPDYIKTILNSLKQYFATKKEVRQVVSDLSKKQDELISSGASAGQFPKIKSVDSNGKPTEWDTAVAPGVGGYGYSESGNQVLAEDVSFRGEFQLQDFNLVYGEKYDVIFDGILYSNLEPYNDDGYITIGAPYGNYSDYPFNIRHTDNSPPYVYALGNIAHVVTISRSEEIIHKIDEKYLPENDLLKNKVDKVEGKGLSSNDFTTLEKQKLESLKIINPIQKTEEMTQQVGIDGNGQLWATCNTNQNIFYSYEEAVEYASTNPLAYVGQSITVVDSVLDTVTVYVISNSNMELSSVGGSSSISDYNNIENKPKINGITLIGDKSSEDLNIDTVSMTNSDIEAILF